MEQLIDFLIQLGLEKDEAAVYLSIFRNGLSTTLEISRDAQLKRTNVYRICEQLEKKGYLAKNAQWRTTKYEAVSPDYLQTKIKSREDELESIKNKYQSLLSTFDNLEKTKDHQTKVIHYSGKEEVKQLVWNSLNAKTVIKSFGYKTLSEPLGKLFVVRWWNQYVAKNIKTQLIANPGTFEIKNRVDQFTKEKYLKVPAKTFQAKIIDPKILKITQETFIYNDVFAIVQWGQKKVFGMEIYNQSIADQERAVFNVLWKIAARAKTSV